MNTELKPKFSKYIDGLVPVMVQDFYSMEILMQGYMNEEAYQRTLKEKRVTFYSRSKKRLWTKGESSKNYLDVVEAKIDCDYDSILIKVKAHGPTCHTGSISCFKYTSLSNKPEISEVEQNHFTLYDLEKTIHQRIDEKVDGSYTYFLIQKGINKVAQKVGEEAVETVIDAVNGTDADFLYEASDLMYHYIVLLKAKGFTLKDIEAELAKRK